MKKSTIRKNERANFVKEHQPSIWEAPKFFYTSSWYSRKLKQFRKTQNNRQRAMAKANILMNSYYEKLVRREEQYRAFRRENWIS